jgi:hypothetical protein
MQNQSIESCQNRIANLLDSIRRSSVPLVSRARPVMKAQSMEKPKEDEF